MKDCVLEQLADKQTGASSGDSSNPFDEVHRALSSPQGIGAIDRHSKTSDFAKGSACDVLYFGMPEAAGYVRGSSLPSEDQTGHPQKGNQPETAVHEAAMIELRTGETAKEAVATIDNSKAVAEMFPGNQEKQQAAYCIMMHDLGMPGYPNIDSAVKQLTDAELQQVTAYTKSYKPSIDPARVDNEVELIKDKGSNLTPNKY